MNGTVILQRTPSTAPALECPTGPAFRILMVDDELLIRRFNARVLALSGYQVETAEDGAVAWDALQQKDYDLLITDQQMPNLTGFGLLKKIHAARLALPVIMVTGTFPQAEFIREPWLRPDASLLKPCDITEFLDTVQEVLCAKEPANSPANVFPRPRVLAQSPCRSGRASAHTRLT